MHLVFGRGKQRHYPETRVLDYRYEAERPNRAIGGYSHCPCRMLRNPINSDGDASRRRHCAADSQYVRAAT